MTATQKTAKTSAKTAASPAATQCAAAPLRGKMLTGEDLLHDMEAYGRKVSATPEAARDFLTRLGALDKHGKRRNLIRG